MCEIFRNRENKREWDLFNKPEIYLYHGHVLSSKPLINTQLPSFCVFFSFSRWNRRMERKFTDSMCRVPFVSAHTESWVCVRVFNPCLSLPHPPSLRRLSCVTVHFLELIGALRFASESLAEHQGGQRASGSSLEPRPSRGSIWSRTRLHNAC